MTYETLQLYSQLVAGSIFLCVLAGVAFYTFRPSNRLRFEEASRIPLETNAPTEQR